MKKTITVTAALIGAAILSGPASAFTDKHSRKIFCTATVRYSPAGVNPTSIRFQDLRNRGLSALEHT